jgi:hypothetical protein
MLMKIVEENLMFHELVIITYLDEIVDFKPLSLILFMRAPAIPKSLGHTIHFHSKANFPCGNLRTNMHINKYEYTPYVNDHTDLCLRVIEWCTGRRSQAITGAV